MRRVIRNRALGVAFVGLIVLGVFLVYAIFAQKFTRYDTVYADAAAVGLNLPDRADVKVRGEIIGEVTKVRATGGGAVLSLGIQPDKIKMIPANVTASVLPKTLFGEKFVSLDIPSSPSSVALRSGDTIDRTKLPTEVQQVLNNIYPLLTAVQPADLNYTLNALSTALEGRGPEIGETIQTLDSYLKRLNPKVPALIADLNLLGKVSENYADVTPQLASILRNSVTTGGTLKTKQLQVNEFLRDTANFSDTAKAFLDANGQNIIRIGQVTKPTVELLQRYSSEFPCLLKGLVNLAPKLADTFRGFVFHIQLNTIAHQPRGYGTEDLPVYGAANAPYCGTLPTPPYSPSHVDHHVPDFNDGVKGQLKRPATEFDKVLPTAGTAEEKAVVVSLAAPVLGVPADKVPDITTLLFGPLARGQEVSFSK